jgi:hypothetical protein
MKCPHCGYNPDEGEQGFLKIRDNPSSEPVYAGHFLIYACPKCKKVFID